VESSALRVGNICETYLCCATIVAVESIQRKRSNGAKHLSEIHPMIANLQRIE
jgi:hypothetical protein